MTRTTIAVGVVDNDRLSLEMLKRIVLQQPIFTLKWAVSDSAVAIQSCLDTASRPDVLLTDMALDGMSGAELCKLVHQMAPSVRFVGVTAFPQTPTSSSAAQRPFCIVAKDNFRAIPATIVNAMRPIPDQAGSNDDSGDSGDNTRGDVNAETHTRVTVPATPRLSRRELETLRYYAQGLSTNDITGIMQTSKGTLRSYEERALAKLHARNRTEAVAICERLHLFG